MREVENEGLNKCAGMKISLKEYWKAPEHRALNNEVSKIVEVEVKLMGLRQGRSCNFSIQR